MKALIQIAEVPYDLVYSHRIFSFIFELMPSLNESMKIGVCCECISIILRSLDANIIAINEEIMTIPNYLIQQNLCYGINAPTMVSGCANHVLRILDSLIVFWNGNVREILPESLIDNLFDIFFQLDSCDKTGSILSELIKVFNRILIKDPSIFYDSRRFEEIISCMFIHISKSGFHSQRILFFISNLALLPTAHSIILDKFEMMSYGFEGMSISEKENLLLIFINLSLSNFQVLHDMDFFMRLIQECFCFLGVSQSPYFKFSLSELMNMISIYNYDILSFTDPETLNEVFEHIDNTNFYQKQIESCTNF